jgi:hypothetical protein
MEEIENMQVQRKEKIKNWLKNPYNFVILGIIIFAFLIRVYYFWITKNQPLWWDEAEYMSAAKSYAGVVHFEMSPGRLPGFPIVASLFFMLGVTNELILRFFLTFIPSLIVILLTYFVIREMYPDKKITLISTAIVSVLWEHLFYSDRFHTENFSLIFEFFAIIIAYKVYMKKENLFFFKPKYSIVWIVVFSAISVYFRPGNLPFVPVLFAFLLFLNQAYFIEGKRRIYSAVALLFVIFLSVIFIINIPNISLLKSYYQPQNSPSWISLSVFKGFYESLVPAIPSVFYYAFFLGALISAVYVVLMIDKLKEIRRDSDALELKSNIFNFFTIIVALGYFVFMLRSPGIEYRWFFMFLPGMLSFTSKGIIDFSEFFGKILKSKKIAILLIFIISVLGLYTQLVHANMIIKMKVDSYAQVKESGLWIKENSDRNDVIISASQPQHTYYSERRIENFYAGGTNQNETAFNEKVKQLNPKYVVVSVFEPGFTPQWAYDWPQRNNNTIRPVNAYFLDKEQKQLALVIYEVLY